MKTVICSKCGKRAELMERTDVRSSVPNINNLEKLDNKKNTYCDHSCTQNCVGVAFCTECTFAERRDEKR